MQKELSKASEEMYLKALLHLSSASGLIGTVKLSKALKVSPASVTQMLEKLSKKGLVVYRPYHGACLTTTGKKSAGKILKRYLLLKRFFAEMLQVSEPLASSQACIMEHFISESAERKIKRLLDSKSKVS